MGNNLHTQTGTLNYVFHIVGLSGIGSIPLLRNHKWQDNKNRFCTILKCFILIAIFFSCQQEEDEPKVTYSEDIYSLKEYKVERHPPVVRNGFGMDIYHEGNSGLDSMYLLSDYLPSWHPNTPYLTGYTIKRYNEESGDYVDFKYDLLFYNEFAYSQNYAGDYNGTGYPVIFMYTNPENESDCTRAAMVGIGIEFFESFTADSITSERIGALSTDPLINLLSLRTELHTETVEGSIMLRDSVDDLYASLTIGNKFRPSIGDVITGIDADDETQINYQPVFLIRTREGLYAKFMVTRFKGVGADTQKLTLQWQALKNE